MLMQSYQDEIIVFNEQLFRIQGEKMKQLLHRSIGCLTFLNRYKMMSAGSGVLISKDLILTGAHNIYDKQNQCQYTHFKFYLGVNGIAENYHEIQVWRYPEQFKSCSKNEKLPFDYGIMKLKTAVNFEQYLSLSIPCQICLPNDQKQVGVFGFPCSYQNFTSLDEKGTKIKLFQYGLIRKDRIVVVDIANFKIGYGISTLGGQSGCPVTVDDSIIAIHVGGDKGQFNVGRIVEISLVQNIRKWEEQLEGTSSAIKDYSNCHHQKKSKLELQMSQLSLESIDLSEYSSLLELNLTDNKLKQIDLSHTPHLTSLDLTSNSLDQIDISPCSHLTYFNISYNFLRKVDVKGNKSLEIIGLDNNFIAEVEVSQNTKLTQLWVQSNKLTSIDLHNNPNLSILRLSKNSISSIDLSHNTQLTQLYLQENQLIEIDLAYNGMLQALNMQNNLLLNIDIRNNNKLDSFSLDYNKLSVVMITITNRHLKWTTMGQQKSESCSVRLYCKEEYRIMAENMCETLKSRYSRPQHNIKGCKYGFEIIST